MIRFLLSEILEEQGITNFTAYARKLDMARSTLVNHRHHDLVKIELSSIEKYCKDLDITPNELFNITNDDGTPWQPSGIRKKRR